jgi:hypothetical protein
MTRRPQAAHWMRENHLERTPFRVLVVDTETRVPDPADPDHQELRLWAARLTRRREVDPGKPRAETFRGHTAAELVALVDGLARSDRALWVMTHNLNFDLAVTELPVRLTEIGWRVTDSALTTDSPWCRMTRGSRRLTIADTFSWLPTSVEALGQLQGQAKVELPDDDDTEAAWWDRCEQDVAITADAIGAAMDWWEAGRFGNWSVTGPATGWSSYRHHKPGPRVLIIPDDEARAFEMRAVTGGRREARRLGRLPGGLYADLDLTTAHLTAMASLALPYKRLGSFDSLPLDHRALVSSIVDVLAECIVTTVEPRYPWDSGAGIFYPVGTFRSVLSGPEVREARARGELVAIGRGYLYLLSTHMQSWAQWLATLLDPALSDAPPAVRLMAKHWSRCVPGKWAGHSSEVLRRDPDPRPGWGIERACLMPGRRPADLLRIGGERWTIVRDEWADDAFPAVLAFIQGATRVAVGRLVDQLGSALVSVNTDGVLVDVLELIDGPLAIDGEPPADAAGQLRWLDRACLAWDLELDPFSVRIKAAAASVQVISPQHLVLGRERRLSGIPKRAKRLGPGTFTFTQWPKLRVQLQRPDPHGYRTRQATVDLMNVPPTGWLLASGRVEPAMVAQTLDHQDALCPPWGTVPPSVALAPCDRQHPVLRRLLGRTEAVA